MNFNESTTKVNLARAFAAECQAGARYQFMSKLALSDNQQFLSDTLKGLAKNEMAHAKIFYDFIIEKSGGTYDNISIEAGYPFETSNLDTSLFEESKTELAESNNIYPSFSTIAKDEGFEDISNAFTMVAQVESHHHDILTYLSKLYKSHNMYKRNKDTIWQCSTCGYSYKSKEAKKECPLCSLPQGHTIIDIKKEIDEN